ncbi:MAG: hypothetical protein C0402_15245 [Thermodesulfovibrio sp.]|nr:hypothetical protein [Thermodesulfovibrio sp.]
MLKQKGKMTKVPMFQTITVVVFALMVSAGASHAFPEYVTPYGDYCREYNNYGSCKEAIPQQEAMKAIERYYREKGYRIRSFTPRGRFIEADVYKNDRQVDKVIFDRKTGRLRSVY